MRLLIDVDALCKLAHWGLLTELPALLGVDLAECSTLASAKYRALKAIKKLDKRVFHDTEAAQRVLDAVEQMHAPLEPDSASLGAFEDVAGIDAGEAVLFATLAATPGAKLLTGDKRALNALAQLPAKVREPFEGRIICVERVVEAALNLWGLERLRAQVCPWKKIDIAVDIIMGSRCDLAEHAVRGALGSYIAELEGLCRPTLICKEVTFFG